MSSVLAMAIDHYRLQDRVVSVDEMDRPAWVWASVGAVLTAAVFVLPGLAASWWSGAAGMSVTALPTLVPEAFAQFFKASTGHVSGALGQVVGFWRTFHIVKAVLAGALVVFVAAAACTLARPARDTSPWRGSRADRRGAAARLLVATASLAALGMLAVVVLVANIQGAVAPLSSALTFLPAAGTPGPASPAVDAAVQVLRSGQTSPVTQTLVADFRTYHLVMAWCAGLVVLGVVFAVMARLWKVLARRQKYRGRTADEPVALDQPRQPRRPAAGRTSSLQTRRRPRPWGVPALAGGIWGAAMVVSGGFFALVGVANVGTVLHTAPALVTFFVTGAS